MGKGAVTTVGACGARCFSPEVANRPLAKLLDMSLGGQMAPTHFVRQLVLQAVYPTDLDICALGVGQLFLGAVGNIVGWSSGGHLPRMT